MAVGFITFPCNPLSPLLPCKINGNLIKAAPFFFDEVHGSLGRLYASNIISTGAEKGEKAGISPRAPRILPAGMLRSVSLGGFERCLIFNCYNRENVGSISIQSCCVSEIRCFLTIDRSALQILKPN